MADPRRGEIWLADLGTGRGHEQAGQRPALVVSDDAFNAGLAGLVMVTPLTSKVAKSMPIFGCIWTWAAPETWISVLRLVRSKRK